MFKVLLAASPSFTDADLFERHICYSLQYKAAPELHFLTQKVFTKMCTDLCKKFTDLKPEVYARDFFNDRPQTTMILYEQILQTVDAVIIFWDGETSNEERLIKLCQELNIKYRVIVFKSLKQQLKDAREAIKAEPEPKRKRITVQITKESKQRYCEAHAAWSQRTYPTACKDGLYTPPKVPIINSGSRMDTFIVNFLVWSGWSATTVRATGRQVNGKYIPGTTKKGTFDITATIKGRSVKIETKHGSDKPSPEQLKMQERERNAGAVAEFVHSVEEFFELYDKIINQ